MAFRVASLAARAARRLSRNGAVSLGEARAFSSQALAVGDDRFLKYNSPHPVKLDHTTFLSEPETKVTTLPNGLRVATSSAPFAETTTVGVWIDAGSRFETAATNGTAHFLEHMVFKGTSKRSRMGLEVEVENMGGHLNAYTSREQTTYYVRVLKKNVSSAVDILSDILQNSTFNPKRIDSERSIILREMQEVESQTEEVMFDHLHATAFQYTPLGRTILGPAENIQSIQREDLENYISTHYTAPRMVLAASGAVDHDSFVELAEKAFTSLSTDPTTALELVKREPSAFTGSEIRIRNDEMPAVHLTIAVEGCSWTDPDAVPLMVMQTMLGGWNQQASSGVHSGSTLVQTVAANHLAESITCFNTNYSDTGLFGIFAVAKPDALDDLSWAIMHELTKMIYRVSDEDVIRACNQLKSALLLHLDGSGPVAEDIGRQLLIYGRRMPIAELIARIDAVTPDTIKRVADRFIYDKDLAIAAMGPTQFLPDYNWLRRRTFWLRY
eukprot:TRINITY_DN22272_c0_g1_i1.p1 TRINITY_DN22272_c0_g1~~TRINITY_DN22272_c0_g1_i1.p1  ORF type:complete len:499 (+),score=83.22 TRINITY_DN22272_c0_g1_i1:100-1596(+)